jgi:hypothetical protein
MKEEVKGEIMAEKMVAIIGKAEERKGLLGGRMMWRSRKEGRRKRMGERFKYSI